ncbi:MAG TPA: carboxyl transferase domain-containing protein [Mycobacteriales bacterium]|nr:carboxyl transferase domain-containing protein [Mycobacteriales bacterium]
MSADDARLPGWSEALATVIDELPGSEVLHCSIASVEGRRCVLVRWDFGRKGGTFGVAEADAFVAAVTIARERQLPLVTVTRTGGTRLPEGMRALVGIPRAALALDGLRAAGVPHICIADNPTTGGVWVAIGAGADLRLAVARAVLGFSGPRVVTAMTGRPLPAGGNTAESAFAAGLVDAVGSHDEIGALLRRALDVLAADHPQPVDAPQAGTPPRRTAAAQLKASREVDRRSGDELIDLLLADRIELRGNDDGTRAAIGRLAGRRVVAVALAGPRGAMPGPGGYALLSRAAALAGSHGLALVVLVDTPGADPHREADGLVRAMGQALLDVLRTPAPTVALVHGEGGSGGALAGAVTDIVGIGEFGTFSALGPEGAAAALRTSPEEAAAVMRIAPAELLADGFADSYVASGDEVAWCATAIDAVRAVPTEQRMTNRCKRWSSALPNQM